MKNDAAKAETPEFTRKNGNVFAQLDRPDAVDLLRKSRVMSLISDVVKRRGLTQEAAAALVGVDQADVSRLANGRVGGFSLDRLMTIVDRLDIEIHFEQRRDKHGHLVVECENSSANTPTADSSAAPGGLRRDVTPFAATDRSTPRSRRSRRRPSPSRPAACR